MFQCLVLSLSLSPPSPLSPSLADHLFLWQRQTMKVFEHYPEDILREVCRYVLHDTFLANETREYVCVCVC